MTKCRTSRSFLEKFSRLFELSKDPGLAWFIPCLIQPIHALMILLKHLSACPHVDQESKLNRDLVDQVFNIRIGRIMGSSHHALKPTPDIQQQYNTRYRTLAATRVRIWTKFKWPIVLPNEAQQTSALNTTDLQNTEYPLLDLGATVDTDLGDLAIWKESDIMTNGIQYYSISDAWL
jgi:hypothetical protein